MTGILRRIQERGRQTGREPTGREGRVGVMLPQAKEHVGPPEAGTGQDGSSPEVLERLWPCQHLDFRLLASRIVGK